jgi:alkylation response protein AidB-like acyl-CoA dehydrogenase
MDLTLSAEEELLATSVRRFCETRCQPAIIRDSEADPEGFSRTVWRELCGLGWNAIALPADEGGSSGSILDMTVVAEELGRSALTVPLTATLACAALPLLWSSNDDLRRRWMPSLAAGDAIGTAALLGPAAGDEWCSPSVHGHRASGGWALRGLKTMVPYAASADVILTPAILEDAGESLVAVASDSPGLVWSRQATVGGHPTYEVSYNGVHITDAQTLATGDDRRAILNRAIDHATVLELAYAVGLCEAALSLSIAHVSTREQFGRQLGAFQAVAHRCVDMRVDIDACRYLTFQAAWQLDQTTNADLEVATAKAYTNDAIRRVFINAHQVHGAIGFSMEYDLQLFSRRAKTIELLYGSTSRQLERIAVALGMGSPRSIPATN